MDTGLILAKLERGSKLSSAYSFKKIPLNKGKFAVVDSLDYPRLAGFKWRVSSEGYACRTVFLDGEYRTIYMHRVILGTPQGKVTDHINLDKLDNRRINLRVATYSQNKLNERKKAGCTSRYKGVTWFEKYKRWMAYVRISPTKTKTLGYFASEKQAAAAYNTAARIQYGEFAVLNEV